MATLKDETEKNKEKSLTSDIPRIDNTDRGIKFIPMVILLSFLFGLAGSVVGNRFLDPNYLKNGITNDIRTIDRKSVV